MVCVRRCAVISGNFISSERQRLAWLLGGLTETRNHGVERRGERHVLDASLEKCRLLWLRPRDSVRTVTGITVIIRLSSDERQIDDGDLCPFNDSPWRARTRNDSIFSWGNWNNFFSNFRQFQLCSSVVANRLNFG